MKPSPDDPHPDHEAPMTRAFHSPEAAGSSWGGGIDSEGTQQDEDEKSKRGSSPGLSEFGSSSMSGSVGQSTGGAPRGVFGRIAPGQILYSKYHVIRKLGGGAMGDVWLVRHASMDDLHALKLIVANIASNQVALKRFQREFKVMASLKHPHAVQIYDARIDDDGGYIDMEYVDGRTIHEVLSAARVKADRDPSLSMVSLTWMVRILDQLTDVLQEAHEKGIIHRDLKPSNMMLLDGRKRGREILKVLDFGIAKIRDDPDNAANMTMTQGFIGTPSYGSPEQALNRQDIDGRADLYSVGVILYEMITGKLPFKGVHFQVLHQHATMPPPSFAEANPALVPLPNLERVILRTLSKDRAERPQSARDLFDEVAHAIEIDGGGVGSRIPQGSTWEEPGKTRAPSSGSSEYGTEHDGGSHGYVTGGPATIPTPSTEAARIKPPGEGTSEFGGEVEPPRSPWKILLGLASLALVLVTVSVIIYLSRTREERRPPPPPTFNLPEGYVRTDSARMNADKTPEVLRRVVDGVEFTRFATGIYLPTGYSPVDPTELVDGWPRQITCDKDVSHAKFIRIQGNKEWTMGAWDAPGSRQGDVPAHQVFLRSGFYMQETEVTNGQFENYLQVTGQDRPSLWERAFQEILGGPEPARQHPAVYVSRERANAYARYFSAMLPTEAQWEYAARSEGKQNRFIWGNQPAPSKDLARIDSQDALSTFPVGSFRKKDVTEQGLVDMAGNVMEMCRDVWRPYAKRDYVVKDPCEVANPGESVEYVIRGSDFGSPPDDCTTTFRLEHRRENESFANIGFRLVIECPDARPVN